MLCSLQGRCQLTGMKTSLSILLVASSLAASPPASAQDFPARPVTIVAPYGPGGTTDILARIVAEGMRGPLGQSVVIENVAGASGTMGVGRVARAAPDGYTLSIGNWGTHVVNGAVQRLPYDLINDLAPIAVLPGNPRMSSSPTPRCRRRRFPS
jgi:tripartite-type tricarboxylate transporter receptor subunit TctC